MIQIGQVLEIHDPGVRPPKPKWHICICHRQYLFLRINSRPLWAPHHPLAALRNPFLDHDSYVELRQLHHFSPNAVIAALRLPKNPLGSLTATEAYALALAARRAKTLSEERKDLVWENLTTGFPA